MPVYRLPKFNTQRRIFEESVYPRLAPLLGPTTADILSALGSTFVGYPVSQVAGVIDYAKARAAGAQDPLRAMEQTKTNIGQALSYTPKTQTTADILQTIADATNPVKNPAMAPAALLSSGMEAFKRYFPAAGNIADAYMSMPLPVFGQISPAYMKKLSKMKDLHPNIKAAMEMQKMIDQAVAAGRTEFARNPKINMARPNMEYGLSFDGDLLCRRSIGSDLGGQRILNAFKENYDPAMVQDYIQRLHQEGLQTRCPQCYVFSNRFGKNRMFAPPIELGEGAYSGTINKLKVNPLPGGGVEIPINYRGNTLYVNELRNSSSTDLKPTHLPGHIVQQTEAALRGIPEGGYTKTPLYPEVYGPAGGYVNISTGRDAKVGADPAMALEQRAKHPNVGTTYIPFTEKETFDAMKSPTSDHLIPWHGSQRRIEDIVAEIGEPNVTDYTRYQNEFVPTGTGFFTRSPVHFAPIQYGWDLGKYLDLVRQANAIPKYPMFLLGEGAADDIKNILTQIRRSKTTDVSPFWDYVNANKNLIDQNYLKFVGPEYGKFLGPYPYQPINPDLVNIDYAFKALQDYLADPNSLVPNKQRYLDLADEIIQKYNSRLP